MDGNLMILSLLELVRCHGILISRIYLNKYPLLYLGVLSVSVVISKFF
jgi:hypothetical protein